MEATISPGAAKNPQKQQQQQQQLGAAAASGLTAALPGHVLDLVAQRLSGGSLHNFRQACRACREAAGRQTRTLDAYELLGHCGGGGGGPAAEQPGCNGVPEQLLAAAAMHANACTVLLPSSWRHWQVARLLRRADELGAWRRLHAVSLHFHALTPAAGAVLGAMAPQLAHLTLFLDLALQHTSRPAWRVGALAHLPALESLAVEADLRPEALRALSGLPALRRLELLGPNQYGGHPHASLEALAALTQLTALRFSWQAGRTMRDAGGLAALTHLRELHVWLAGGAELPPCSSKPLGGLLLALGQLTALTHLRLLRGLYMSWDLRQLRHLSQQQHLQVLCLHDSVVSEEELALLLPCVCLEDLGADTLKLSAVRSPQPGVHAADAATPPPAAAGLAHPPPAAGDPQPAALVVLARLRRLSVNMLQLGLWQLDEAAPQLTHLGPLEATLGPRGHGVVWDLGAVEGHPRLQSVALMLGALGTTCSCHKSFKAAASAESLAAAVVRVLLQSAGIGRGAGAPAGCSAQQLLRLLQSLPRLQRLELWGHAGGLSGKTLASCAGRPQRRDGTSSASSSGSSGSGSGGSGGGGGSGSGSGGSGRSSPTAGVASAIGLLSSFGSLLGSSPYSGRSSDSSDGSSGDGGSSGWAGGGKPAAAMATAGNGGDGSPGAPGDGQPPCRAAASLDGTACGEAAEERFVRSLLCGLPRLQLLELSACRHLQQGGRALAARSCGRHGGGATVAVAPEQP